MLFKTTITEQDNRYLTSRNWSAIECSALEPYVSRIRGEWSKQVASIKVSADYDQDADPNKISFIEGHFLGS